MFENLNVVAIVVAVGCAMVVIGAIIRCIINVKIAIPKMAGTKMPEMKSATF